MNPVKLVITNYEDGKTEEMDAINNPENEADGSHKIIFSKELWIEREDFMEDAPNKFFRMTPGKEVRLKNAYIVMWYRMHQRCRREYHRNPSRIRS